MSGKFYETSTRSIVKTITWRLLATLTTILLVFIFTRKVTLALEIGGLELVAKLIFYYFHERIWNKVKWGHTNQAKNIS